MNFYFWHLTLTWHLTFDIYLDLTRSTEISQDLLRSHKIYWFGIIHLTFGIWHLTFGIWHLTFGIWHLVFDIWHAKTFHDIWHWYAMEFDIWRLSIDIWHLTFDIIWKCAIAIAIGYLHRIWVECKCAWVKITPLKYRI